MKFLSRLSFRCGMTALAAVCLLSISGPAWGEETKPATTPATTAAAPAAAAPATPPDPHKSADPVGATTGTDFGADMSAAKGAHYTLTDVPDREKDGSIKKDKDGKVVLLKDEKGALVKGIVLDVSIDELKQQSLKTRNGLNLLWTCLAGFMVFFMQAGFALVETGFTRAKNASHCMGMNMMVFCIGFIGYYVCGFAFMFGGLGATGTIGGSAILDTYLIGNDPAGWHFLGGKGFLWSGLFDSQIMAFFMFQMVFMDTAATIPTGSMAERIKWGGFVWMSFFLTMVTYPVIGCWVWGGGWLAQTGAKWAGVAAAADGSIKGALAFGNGAVDFSGSGVIHMVGGWTALVGAYILGPRIGKYDKNGNSHPIPGHDVPMAVLGTIILFFGWFGFNPGSTLAATDGILSVAAVNTMIAGAFGGMSCMLYMMYIHPAKKPDTGMMCNGVLAGLVAITAPCAFVSPTASVLIGSIAGVLVIWAVGFTENTLKVDDPVGAFSVHGVNGLFGVLCVGLFSCGYYGGGLNGVTLTLPNASGAATDYGVLGLFPIGGAEGTPWGYFGQMKAQLLFAVVDIAFVVAIEFAFFTIYDKVFGLRCKAEDEISGLDIPEMGCPAYPNWQTHDAPGLAYDNLPEGVSSPSNR
ncbi:MAG: ammonium transporter [Planctomycetota bacterium]